MGKLKTVKKKRITEKNNKKERKNTRVKEKWWQMNKVNKKEIWEREKENETEEKRDKWKRKKKRERNKRKKKHTKIETTEK